MLMNLEGRKAGKELAHTPLTSRVIAAAIAVHKALGPGFLESFYEEALAIELTALHLSYERQKAVVVSYRNRPIGEHRLDFLIEGALIVELKAVSELKDIHFAIVRSYLKACALDTALLLNFADMPLAIRRVGREHSYYSDPTRMHEDEEGLL